MRLSKATVEHLPAWVARPAYDRAAQRCGIVHFGIGAFHRAHQAVYTDAAMSAGDRDWAITGISLRSSSVQDALRPQDGLYLCTERDTSESRARLVGSVHDIIVAPHRPSAVDGLLANRNTHVVTFTITEKGYCRKPDGSLDMAAVEADPHTIYRYLGKAIAHRRSAGLPGLTLLPCDNLADNGAVLKSTLSAWLSETSPHLLAWFEQECACPSTMVDRIVPASTDSEIAELEKRTGLYDPAAVFTEPYSKWVIEDRFAGRRPTWEAVGAEFVADVRPYETAKLRMLNGAHSALAYLGLAAGHEYVHTAIGDPTILPKVRELMQIDAISSITQVPGQDLHGYAEALLARFANAALRHRLLQIASDGSQKIVPRWLTPLAINAAQGRRCPATLSALAAWIVHVRGDRHLVDDPRAKDLAAIWRNAGGGGIVEALFGPNGMYAATWVADAEDLRFLKHALV